MQPAALTRAAAPPLLYAVADGLTRKRHPGGIHPTLSRLCPLDALLIRSQRWRWRRRAQPLACRTAVRKHVVRVAAALAVAAPSIALASPFALLVHVDRVRLTFTSAGPDVALACVRVVQGHSETNGDGEEQPA